MASPALLNRSTTLLPALAAVSLMLSTTLSNPDTAGPLLPLPEPSSVSMRTSELVLLVLLVPSRVALAVMLGMLALSGMVVLGSGRGMRPEKRATLAEVALAVSLPCMAS